MVLNKKYLTIASVLLVSIILQGIFIVADDNDSPSIAVTEFMYSYYALDPAMSNRLCSDLHVAEGVDRVNEYIFRKTNEAREMGFGINYMKFRPIQLDTEIIESEEGREDSVKVQVSGEYRRSIYPIYAFVAGIFGLGETYELGKVFDVVKEDGMWKVCSDTFQL